MGKLPPNAKQMWVLKGDKLEEVKASPLQSLPKPEPEEVEGSEVPILRGDEPWVVCPLCGEPIQEGDYTFTLNRWFYADPNQKTTYPIIAGNRIAHINCVIQRSVNISMQRVSEEYCGDECEECPEDDVLIPEEIGQNLRLCHDNLHYFNQYEQQALRDFIKLHSSGRLLTDRQQHFLGRMAAFAMARQQETEEALDKGDLPPNPSYNEPVEVSRAKQILAGLGMRHGNQYSELADYMDMEPVGCVIPEQVVCFSSERHGFHEPLKVGTVKIMLERWNFMFLSTIASLDMCFDESMAMQIAADIIEEEFVDRIDLHKLEDLSRQQFTVALNRKLKVMDIRTKGRLVIRGIQLEKKLDLKEIKRIMRSSRPRHALDLYWYARLGVYSAVDPVLEALRG